MAFPTSPTEPGSHRLSLVVDNTKGADGPADAAAANHADAASSTASRTASSAGTSAASRTTSSAAPADDRRTAARGRRLRRGSWSHAHWVPRPRLLSGDRGAVTAEYVLVIMAAVALAGVLVAIMRSSEIRQMLVDLVQSAFGSAG